MQEDLTAAQIRERNKARGLKKSPYSPREEGPITDVDIEKAVKLYEYAMPILEERYNGSDCWIQANQNDYTKNSIAYAIDNLFPQRGFTGERKWVDNSQWVVFKEVEVLS